MNCELCQSDKVSSPYYLRTENNTDFVLSKCKRCELIFKSYPKGTSKDFLSGEYYQLKTVGNVIDERFIRHFSKRANNHYEYINKYYTDQEKYALDIGCGAGFFVKKLINNGWRAKGIESDRAMYQYGISSGLEIENILFEDYHTKDKFGLIYLSHVFDDLPDVKKVLKKIKKLLGENGLLFIEIPNYEWEYRLKKIKYEDLSAGNYFFTRKTLLDTLSASGFKFLDCYTFEPIHLNTVSQIIASPFRLYLKTFPPKMRSYLRAIFIIDNN